MQKGWLNMFLQSFALRKREVEHVSERLQIASQRLQATSNELVKTLDEMLEETDRANRRGIGASYHVSVSHTDKDH